MIRLCGCLIAAALWLQGGINEIKTEPNPERRARLALDNALAAFKEAQTAYAAGNAERSGIDLQEMQTSVELARDALESTGRNPRRRPKYFKLAETETGGLLRRLEGLENSMDLSDRKLIEGPKAKVQEVHDQWLNDIISGKK